MEYWYRRCQDRFQLVFVSVMFLIIRFVPAQYLELAGPHALWGGTFLGYDRPCQCFPL